MSLIPSSTRRPSPLRDADYDHEIQLVDHTKSTIPEPEPERSHTPSALGSGLSPLASDSSSRRNSNVPLRRQHTKTKAIRKEITRRKYAKYQSQGNPNESEVNNGDTNISEDENDEDLEDNTRKGEDAPVEDQDQRRGRQPKHSRPKGSKRHKEPKTEIDILYENQRGGFLCGAALFSGNALGCLDPSPWTNVAHKTSPTNITNAQCPDPSWEWLWPEWRVNHEDGIKTDEDGWEYSFAFSKKFSWHGPKWYSSFVRRRAWIRQRIKKHSGYTKNTGHMLSSDYFTIHPTRERERSRSRASSTPAASELHRQSFYSRHEFEAEIVPEDICDIGALMKALRLARIDREKTEAIDSFIEHAGDDLFYLAENMHEIMRMFIFQTSRRSLLEHLLNICNEGAEKADEEQKAEESKVDPIVKKRHEYLQAAVKHAEEEVKRLEYWSDVKDMAEEGVIQGAVDEDQGWNIRWAGLDGSGPGGVWNNKPAGFDECDKHEGNGIAKSADLGVGKGKGKEQ